MTGLDDILRPPTNDEVVGALARFAAHVRDRYGDRVRGVYLFGSRARRDHKPDSDADIAVVLTDGDWRFWDEKMDLVDLAFDIGVDHRLYVQPWPFSESEWRDPERSPRADLIRSARRDAQAIS
jgi:predicted nucleotidyltransferase